MQKLIIHATEQIFAAGYGDNAEEAATICLVKLKSAITTLDLLAFQYRGKKITDKRRESINDPLARVLYYSSALIQLNKLDINDFDIDILTAFAETFHPDFQQDALLCCNMMLGNACTVMENMFDLPEGSNGLDRDSTVSTVMLGVNGAEAQSGMVVVDAEEGTSMPIGSMDLDEENLDMLFDSEEGSTQQALAYILAGALILVNKFDTYITLFNAGLMESL